MLALIRLCINMLGWAYILCLCSDTEFVKIKLELFLLHFQLALWNRQDVMDIQYSMTVARDLVRMYRSLKWFLIDSGITYDWSPINRYLVVYANSTD